MPRKITPSKKYLEKFASPLWDLLDMENCKPLSIIEGERGDYPFIIIDMQHYEFGFFAGDQRTTVSTFFVVAHRKKINNPRIAQRVADFHVSVDKQHVYLVSPGKKVSPGEWENNLKKTMNVAEDLFEASTDTASEKPSPVTYTPIGRSAVTHAFSAIVCLLFSALFLIEGLGGLFGFIELDPSRSASIKLSLEFLLASPFALFGAIYFYIRFKKRSANRDGF
ncbi:MAG: hypothetical protein HY253_07045 [Burkholderiales bacterium]|nr:hypothetical protein [Burkholderiales bacterium]